MLSAYVGLLPFSAFIGLGIFFGYIKILDLQNAKSLNLFLFYVAIPALIFEAIIQSNLDELKWKILMSYLGMQTVTGFSAFYLTNRVFLKSKTESIIWALTVGLSNHVLIILPVSKIFFKENISLQVSSIIIMDCLVLIPVITLFLEYTTKNKIQIPVFFRDVMINPLILAIILSVGFKTFGIKLNETGFDTIISKLASCTMPVGLFSVGVIVSFHLKGFLTYLTLSITFIKVFISPLILFIFVLITYGVQLPTEYVGAFLVSIGPCGAFALPICAAYGVPPGDFVKAIFVSTFLSLIVLVFAIGFYIQVHR
jgi:hypothetical protein